MGGVTRFVCRGLLTTALSLAAMPVPVQTSRYPSLRRDTWYEFLLKKFNPTDFDYGAWLEQRRKALLESTVREPRFWYSLSATTALMLMIAAYAKLFLDHRRNMRFTAEMMSDLYSHDLYFRQLAKEAIEKYNQHIEQCNRAMEAGSGNGRPGWGNSEAQGLRAELQRVASQLEATTQDRNKLQEELRQKSLIVGDLSTRLDALSKKLNGPRDTGGVAAEPMSTGPNGDGARFVGQINRLQEELYAERQKNRGLK